MVTPPMSQFGQDFPKKRGRGRPTNVSPSETTGRADNYRFCLGLVWNRLWPSLSTVQSEKETAHALQDAAPYHSELVPLAALAFEVVKDLGFPKTGRGRIHFLADSLAARGDVSPRRSRDICATERLRIKRQHRILRFEYYVECSCGYLGPSQNHACPKCKATILFPIGF